MSFVPLLLFVYVALSYYLSSNPHPPSLVHGEKSRYAPWIIQNWRKLQAIFVSPLTERPRTPIPVYFGPLRGTSGNPRPRELSRQQYAVQEDRLTPLHTWCLLLHVRVIANWTIDGRRGDNLHDGGLRTVACENIRRNVLRTCSMRNILQFHCRCNETAISIGKTRYVFGRRFLNFLK